MNLPKHIAIIMDGNGRWAKERNHNRFYGHIRGAKVAYDIIEKCARINLEHLTLFAFSTENWKRPANEVSLLMSLLLKHLKKEQKKLMDNNIRFFTIGNTSELPSNVQDLLNSTIETTKNNTGLKLTFALNYGGQQEILESAKSIIQKVIDQEISLDEINLNSFRDNLQSSFLPDPDLIIRSSNEKRLSNFFLWQSAYSEFYFTHKYWPDFTKEDLSEAIVEFNSRSRRFGNVKASTTPPNQAVEING